ncbi:MAG: hypothetical protein AB7K24_27770 [Gemmataceae bacterium]
MTTAEAIKTLKPPITVEQWAELEGPPHYELVNARLGVAEYWLVDFPARAIEIYCLDTAGKKPKYELKEKVTGPVFRPEFFPGLEIPLAEIWPTEFENRTDE